VKLPAQLNEIPNLGKRYKIILSTTFLEFIKEGQGGKD
jgi:hypothetical protein